MDGAILADMGRGFNKDFPVRRRLTDKKIKELAAVDLIDNTLIICSGFA
jgi:hypothetical protein